MCSRQRELCVGSRDLYVWKANPLQYLRAPHSTSLHQTFPHCTTLDLTAPLFLSAPDSTSLHILTLFHLTLLHHTHYLSAPQSISLHNTLPNSTTLYLTPPHSTSLHHTLPHCIKNLPQPYPASSFLSFWLTLCQSSIHPHRSHPLSRPQYLHTLLSISSAGTLNTISL